MEILRLDPKEDKLATIEEDDEFYEGIEAPKFVDFRVPERSRPDDKSWFCLRIGKRSRRNNQNSFPGLVKDLICFNLVSESSNFDADLMPNFKIRCWGILIELEIFSQFACRM